MWKQNASAVLPQEATSVAIVGYHNLPYHTNHGSWTFGIAFGCIYSRFCVGIP
jgi:hypothetical protein